jgi:hypothetical protein
MDVPSKTPQIKRSKRWVLLLATTVGIATIFTAVYTILRYRQLSSTSAPTPSPTVAIARKVTALGRLEPKGEAVHAATTGSLEGTRILQILVKEGDAAYNTMSKAKEAVYAQERRGFAINQVPIITQNQALRGNFILISFAFQKIVTRFALHMRSRRGISFLERGGRNRRSSALGLKIRRLLIALEIMFIAETFSSESNYAS